MPPTKSKSLIVHNPTFLQWLKTQRAEDTEVGEFARWAKADKGCLPPVEHIRDLRQHLRSHYASPTVLATASTAWTQYRAFRKTNKPIRINHGPDPLPRSQRRIHRGFMVHPQTVNFVQAISKTTGESIGRVIDRLAKQEFQKRVGAVA